MSEGQHLRGQTPDGLWTVASLRDTFSRRALTCCGRARRSGRSLNAETAEIAEGLVVPEPLRPPRSWRSMFVRNMRALFLAIIAIAMPNGVLSAQTGIDIELVDASLVSRMQLQPGERVLLVGVRGRSDELIPALRRRLTAAGATDLGVLAAIGDADPSWSTDFTRAAPMDRTGLAATSQALISRS